MKKLSVSAHLKMTKVTDSNMDQKIVLQQL
jgi:hypothetical protein